MLHNTQIFSLLLTSENHHFSIYHVVVVVVVVVVAVGLLLQELGPGVCSGQGTLIIIVVVVQHGLDKGFLVLKILAFKNSFKNYSEVKCWTC